MWMEMNVEPFRGTGARNEDGIDLEEFLARYHPGDYENPSVTADAVIFAYPGEYRGIDQLKLLMIRRKNHPCIGCWALPGGFVEYREDLEHAAARELEEETGLTDVPLCQLHTWGEAGRDPRTRIITASYLAVIDRDSARVKAGDDAAEAEWFDLSIEKETTGDRAEGQTIFRLTLTRGGIRLESRVRARVTDNGIFRKKEYEILENSGIAFDHARAVVQALDFIGNLTP